MSTDPSWTDVVGAVSLATTAVIVVLSARFGRHQLLDSRRTRHGQLIGDLSRRWDEPLMMQARNSLSRYTAGDLFDLTQRVYENRATDLQRKEFLDRQALPNFLETIGVVEGKVGALPIELVSELWGSAVIVTWKTWAPAVRFLRNQPSGEQTYANLQRLKRRIKSYRARAA